MEFFPLFEEQLEIDEKFKALSPTKKCYYFLLQSMYNKQQGEFYFRDMNFSAALNCSHETIRKARREFVENGWIEIVPGRRDKQGRGLSTTYKNVKWAKTPKKGDGLKYAPIRRYSFEMLLNKQFPHDSLVLWLSLLYWNHFYYLEDGHFFIQKSKLKEITGLKGMNKIEKTIQYLYDNFQYAGEDHLFEYKDLYHKLKFMKIAQPSDPADDENNRGIQQRFWDRVFEQGKELQKKKQKQQNATKLSQYASTYEWFKKMYEQTYGNEPQPNERQINELMELADQYGEKETALFIKRFFTDSSVPGLSSSQRRTLGKFLTLKPLGKGSR